MATMNGTWQAEWTRRVNYFNKQIGKAEKLVDKNDKTPPKQKKTWGYWKKVQEKKKPKETELQKHFSKLDDLYKDIDSNSIEGATRLKKLSEFLAILKVTAKKSNNYAVKEFFAVTQAAMTSDMSDELKKAKKKEIEKLCNILQSDVNSMITSAHTWYTSASATLDKDGNRDIKKITDSTFDPKMLKQKTLAVLTRTDAWVKKAERDPEVMDYNARSKDLSRDVMAVFAQLAINGQKQGLKADYKFAKQLQNYLGPIGQGKGKLPNTASQDDVAAKIVEFKKVLAAAAKWVKGIQT